MLRSELFHLSLFCCVFLLTAASYSLDEDDFSSSIRYTSVFSRFELGLPSDWPLIVVDYEIQALAVTRTVHVLSFFYGLIFHHE